MTARAREHDADVIVVGAGPGGQCGRVPLARRGARVLLPERSTFPCSEVCGDGVTPRGVQQLQAMGVDVPGHTGGAGAVMTRAAGLLALLSASVSASRADRRPPRRAAPRDPWHRG